MTFDEVVAKHAREPERNVLTNLLAMKADLDAFVGLWLIRGVNRYQILNALESAYTRHYKTREPEAQEQM